MSVGYVYDPVYLKHDTGRHVESPRRLEAIMAYLKKSGLQERLALVAPRAATVKEIAAVHKEEHIARVREAAEKGGGWLDSDTAVSKGSYEAALYAAGGVIRATDAVMSGELNSAFALVRPPGHHATAERAMGFCLFNNVAVAVKYASKQHKLARVFILDFDLHHGNGTQEAFYRESRVLYLSTHQYPFYPGTGAIIDTGEGLGRDHTINIPLPAGCGDAEYLAVFEQVVVPAARCYRPQLIMVSAGYDIHWADELGRMQVTVEGFVQMMRIVRELADELCGGRIVMALEGGYNLEALAASVGATFSVLLGDNDIPDPLGPPVYGLKPPDISPIIETARELHGLV